MQTVSALQRMIAFRSFVRRSIRISSPHEKMRFKFVRRKQLLVNNGCVENDIDTEIKRQLDNKSTETASDKAQLVTHHLYYCNHMNSQHETDENV